MAELGKKIISIESLFLTLAVAFQFFITPKINGTAIRISAADLLLPFIGCIFLYRFYKDQFALIKWEIKFIFWFLFILSLWMFVSLVLGYFEIGRIQNWALINKFFGWFVLLGFFVFGALISNQCSVASKEKFFKILLSVALITGAIDIWLFMENLLGLSNYPRIEGFAGNPNAYGFLIAVIMLSSIAWQNQTVRKMSLFHLLTFGILGCLIIFSGSRSAWLAIALGLLALLIAQRINLTHMLKIVLVTVVFFISIISIPEYFSNDKEQFSLYVTRPNLASDNGIKTRIELMESAVTQWQTHPITGVGLGSFIAKEKQKGKHLTIHATTLWLLVETGIIGLSLFTAFFCYVVYELWKRRYDDSAGSFYVGGLAVLIAFMAASIGMEAMYQRHVWFFAGWAIAQSFAQKTVHKNLNG